MHEGYVQDRDQKGLKSFAWEIREKAPQFKSDFMKAFSTRRTAQHTEIHIQELRPLGLAFRTKGNTQKKQMSNSLIIAMDTILRRIWKVQWKTPSGYSCQPKKPHQTRTSPVAYRENREEYPCWDSRAGEKKEAQWYLRGRAVRQSSGLKGQNKAKRRCRNQWLIFTTIKTELIRWHLFFKLNIYFAELCLFSINPYANLETVGPTGVICHALPRVHHARVVPKPDVAFDVPSVTFSEEQRHFQKKIGCLTPQFGSPCPYQLATRHVVKYKHIHH